MSRPSRKIEWAVWGGLVLVIAAVAGAFAWQRLSPAELQLPVLGQLSDFHLTNENNEPMSLADLRGKVWIANIIFTRCPGPCAKMTKRLAELQSELPTGGVARTVTLTSDPDYDKPPVLKRYAEHFGADPARWSFLTGDKKAIRELAVNDFKFVVVEKQPADRAVPDDLFVHSTFFMLVDGQGRLRGWMDGQKQLHAYFDSEDADARAQLVNAVRQLVKASDT